jgi:hypothetical protein
MSENDKEFTRLGAADKLLERIKRTGFGGDEAKALIKNEWASEQLKPLFKSERDFNRFVESVASERGMFETRREVMGDSPTASRTAEDATPLSGAGAHAAHALGAFVRGRIPTGISSSWRAVRELGGIQAPMIDETIARILTDLDSPISVKSGRLSVDRPPPTLQIRPPQ